MVSTKNIFLATQCIFQYFLLVFITCTIWLMAYSYSWNSFHTWHIFLSTIGFALLMGEAIAILNPAYADILNIEKTKRNGLHGLLMACATISIIIGVSLKIHDKTRNNRAHFTSTHGILGFTAFILTIVSVVTGELVHFGKKLYNACGIKPKFISSCHIFLGIFGYVIGIVSLCYGLNNYFSLVDTHTKTAFIVIVAISAFINILSSLKRLLRV